jgi:PcrA/UvrD helicase-like protein
MSDEFHVGDWVRHPEFGDGLVLEARGSGDSCSVLVSFPDNSRRRLMVKFAHLSRVPPPEGHSAPKEESKTKRATRKTTRGS